VYYIVNMQSVFELPLRYWLSNAFIQGTTFPQSLKSKCILNNISKITFVLFFNQ